MFLYIYIYIYMYSHLFLYSQFALKKTEEFKMTT